MSLPEKLIWHGLVYVRDEFVQSLEAQLDAKTAECERLRESQREIAAALGVPGCDAAEMLNVIDSIREDAGRYRWLRCSPGGTMRDWLYMPHTEELDAAIDAERKRHDLR